jgi:CTP:molybdopterin cytidylyltransferase MocA
MNIVITMAGLGSRFLKAGFTKPKFMIEAGDKTLFELSMLSLSDYFPHTHEILFITKKELNAKTFIETICKKLGISFFSIIELDSTTDGQATTAAIGIKNLPRNESVLIYNIDTYIEPGALKFSKLVGDGSIPCFKAEGDHWSFEMI